jgi:hypothetical protein
MQFGRFALEKSAIVLFRLDQQKLLSLQFAQANSDNVVGAAF